MTGGKIPNCKGGAQLLPKISQINSLFTPQQPSSSMLAGGAGGLVRQSSLIGKIQLVNSIVPFSICLMVVSLSLRCCFLAPLLPFGGLPKSSDWLLLDILKHWARC